MSKFKCNDCGHEFEAQNINEETLFCDNCESQNVSKINDGLLKKIPKLPLIVVSVLVLIVLYFIIKPPIEPLKITNVIVNDLQVQVNTKGGTEPIYYSFDSGQKYQQSNVYTGNSEEVLHILVKDEKGKTVKWKENPIVLNSGDPLPAKQTPCSKPPKVIHSVYESNGKIIVSVKVDTLCVLKNIVYSSDSGKTWQDDSVIYKKPEPKKETMREELFVMVKNKKDKSGQLVSYAQQPYTVIIPPGKSLNASKVKRKLNGYFNNDKLSELKNYLQFKKKNDKIFWVNGKQMNYSSYINDVLMAPGKHKNIRVTNVVVNGGSVIKVIIQENK